MLKRLFNNPWFIAAVGAFATIYLGLSVAKPLFFDQENYDDAGSEYADAEPYGDQDRDDGYGDDYYADEYADEGYYEDEDYYDDEYGQESRYGEDGQYDDYYDERDSLASTQKREELVESREHIGWLHDVERDPFADTPFNKQTQQVARLPVLEALFLSKGVQAAVINNKLVHVGDQIAQYRITEIGENYVQLRANGKQYTLEPAS